MPYRFNQLLLLLLTETTFKTMKLVRKRTWKTLRNPSTIASVYRQLFSGGSRSYSLFIFSVIEYVPTSLFFILEECLREWITHFNSLSIASHRQVVLWCQLKAVCTVKGRLNYFEFQPKYNPTDFRTYVRWLAARKGGGDAAQWLIFSGISQVYDALHFDKNVAAKTPASWRNRCSTLISKSFGFFAREISKLAAEFSKGQRLVTEVLRE